MKPDTQRQTELKMHLLEKMSVALLKLINNVTFALKVTNVYNSLKL